MVDLDVPDAATDMEEFELPAGDFSHPLFDEMAPAERGYALAMLEALHKRRSSKMSRGLQVDWAADHALLSWRQIKVQEVPTRQALLLLMYLNTKAGAVALCEYLMKKAKLEIESEAGKHDDDGTRVEDLVKRLAKESLVLGLEAG